TSVTNPQLTPPCCPKGTPNMSAKAESQGIGHPLSHRPPYRPSMNEAEYTTPDEQFVYQERLALLDVLNGNPSEQEHTIAMQDVKHYRSRLSELLAELG
ncbi:MAG: hypothetical protein JWR69_4068, partial [Pedosphaera sp.]|nr:hypothetical protein [Pedosphaera sp.]